MGLGLIKKLGLKLSMHFVMLVLTAASAHAFILYSGADIELVSLILFAGMCISGRIILSAANIIERAALESMQQEYESADINDALRCIIIPNSFKNISFASYKAA